MNSDTVAIDFSHEANVRLRFPSRLQVAGESVEATASSFLGRRPDNQRAESTSLNAPSKSDTDGVRMTSISIKGGLYRVFEGTVMEGVVTNHIDGGLSGPILVMLTTDYYSHDHQQLLMPQGTRLIGTVQSVGNAQQRKMFVTFHRAVCPDGFSLDFDKYIGLDQIGTDWLGHQRKPRLPHGLSGPQPPLAVLVG